MFEGNQGSKYHLACTSLETGDRMFKDATGEVRFDGGLPNLVSASSMFANGPSVNGGDFAYELPSLQNGECMF